MSNITRFPPRGDTIRVEVDIPLSQRDEFDRAVHELIAGKRPRMEALEAERTAIKTRALVALQRIEQAITDHPTTGGAASLVRFLSGCYNGSDYPFDLALLRTLDTDLAAACLDYLNYDRLGSIEVHRHLAGGEPALRRWLEEYGVEPVGAAER